MEQKNWWDDFLNIENASTKNQNPPTVKKQKQPQEMEVVFTPDHNKLYFNNDAVEELELNDQELEIYARMNELSFYELQRFFTLGVYYDIIKQQSYCRAKLFDTTVKLEALKAKGGQQKDVEALERLHKQLTREMDFLTEEIEELEVVMLDLGFLDDDDIQE